MIPYNKVKFRDLKNACRSANLSGLLPKNIRHTGVKGAIVYDNFLAAIEALPDEVKVELPDDVIDFYNYVITDDEEETLEELNLDPEEIPSNSEEMSSGPEETFSEENIDISTTTETIPTPVRKVEERPTSEKKEEKADLTKEVPKKRIRHSTVVMTLHIDDTQLTIEFKELKKKKIFKLPPKGDLDELKVFRKTVMEYATKYGATSGQRAAVSKALNSAGYYVTRRGSK